MDREKKHISEFDMQAIVDGEFDEETHALMMEKIRKHPGLRERLGELFHQKFMLKEWWSAKPHE